MNYLKSSIMVLALVALAACGGNKNASEEAMNKLNAHLTQIADTINTPEGLAWAKETWGDLDGQFGTLKDGVTAIDAEADLSALEGKWEEIGTKVSEYTPEVEQADSSAMEGADMGTVDMEGFDYASSTYISDVNTALGIASYDASFETVTKENIADAYKNFVKTVEMNYNKYNAQEATVIVGLWKKLNDRKNEVEPIKPGDNIKITGQKAKFTAIRAGLMARTKVLGKEGEEEKEMPEAH